MDTIKAYLKIILLFAMVSSCGDYKLLRQYELKPATIKVQGDKAYINGILGKTFYRRFVKTLGKNPQLKTIVLQEVPGSIDDEWNLKSCFLLYKKGLHTKLEKNSIVESGGTDFFISGKELHIEEGAKIGVHSWAGNDLVATELPKNHPEHKLFLEFYPKIEIDTAFYWFTIRAAPENSMHFLSTKEINLYLGHKLKK